MQKGLYQYPSIPIRIKDILCFIMKCSFISTVIQLILANILIAGSGYGQNLEKKTQLKIENASIKESLLAIEENSGVRFLYRDDLLNSVRKNVTLNGSGITVREAIREVLKNTPLEYKVMQGFVTIIQKPVPQRITGKVIDGGSKETLPGVSIRIKGLPGGTVTDINGNFSITINQPEAILVFSYMGYNSREVKVGENSLNLTVSLSASSMALNEVTVQARRRTNTEISVLEERKKSAIVQDAISAVQIERTGSITTTQALQKVAGITITDDKYVAIRGLGDRSVVGQLNGIRLASSDPDRSSIPLDLVPASLLDNITIYKTVTPDKPADAAAGIVELKTKSVPDSMVVEFVIQSGFNSNIGIGGQHNSFYNSDMGFLGRKINEKNLSADFLNLAQQYKGGQAQIQQMIANSDYSPAVKQEVNRINGIMHNFDPVLTTGYKQSPANQLYSASFGNSYTLFRNHKLGVIAGANYYRRTLDVSGGQVQQYSIYQGVVTGNPQIKSPRNIPNYITPNSLFMGKYQTYKENTGTEMLNYGTLLGLTYRFNPQHEISMQYLGSWGGETLASNMRGSYEYTDLPGDVNSTIYSLRQSYRKLNTFNLQGEHKFFKGKYSPGLSYNIASSRAGQNDPDYRYVNLIDYAPRGGAYIGIPGSAPGTFLPGNTYTDHLYALSSGYVNGFGTYGIIQAEPNGRRYRNLSEKNYNYKADVTLPFKFLGKKQEFKTGVNYLNRDRDFTENVLFLPGSNFSATGVSPLYTVEGNLNRLVSSDVIGIQPLAGNSNGEGAGAVGGFIYNSQKSPNNYTGFFETKAAYAMLDLKLTEDLRVTGGLRFESSNIQSAVDTAGVFLDPALTTPGPDGTRIPLALVNPNSVYKTGYKPYYSLNITYNVKKNMNFRAGYNTTLARPELREITNVFEFDAFQMGLVAGNPDLVNQSTQNLDFRWEWFPRSGEVIALSLFGKRIENQLYKVFNLQTSGLAATYPEYPTIRFENDPNIGKVWGLELEIVKDLGQIWEPLNSFFFGSNLLLAQSEIKKSAARLKANRSLDRHTPDNSPLFEQAPYSINGWLNYNNNRIGTSLTGTFNMTGERLVQINLTGEPDLYTRPVPVLDFVFSQRIVKRITFKGYAKNILNPSLKTVYANPGTGGKWYGNEYLNRSYKRGAEIMVGFTYKLF